LIPRHNRQTGLGAIWAEGIPYEFRILAATGGDETATENANRVAQLLNAEQVLEAQRLSRDWRTELRAFVAPAAR